METKLFTNEIKINASVENIENILGDQKNVLKWDPEIIDVNQLNDNQFMILRNRGSLNSEELISVVKSDNQIIYKSTTGKVEYQLIWGLSKVSKTQTLLKQSLVINEKNAWVPIAKLLRPVMQSAFSENLRALKVLSELERV